MEFFDDAVNKTKEVFQTVSKKTSEVIATEKQKFDIASLKAKRDKDYLKLGKIYFEAVKDDENIPDDIKSAVEDIKAKTEEIDRLNAEVQSAKDKKICPNCGANINKNSVYCNICGVKLENDGE